MIPSTIVGCNLEHLNCFNKPKTRDVQADVLHLNSILFLDFKTDALQTQLLK